MLSHFPHIKAGQAIRDLALRRDEQHQEEARRWWPYISKDPFFMLGLGLFWGEGTKWRKGKRPDGLSLTNSDPGIIKTWIKWCRGFTSGEFYMCLQIHEDISPDIALKFWQEVTGQQKITISIVHCSSNSRKGKLSFGTLRVKARKSTKHIVMVTEWMRLAALE